jgi:ADP-ribose pyrophosphatase
MKKFEEVTIKSETIFEGKVVKLQLDEVRLPNGKTATRELVKHPGAVAVLALTDNDKMIVVEQYRKPLERSIVEIPAGKLERGEEPLECAGRELQEETGFTAKQINHLCSFYTSPGFADEILHLYIAEGLTEGEANPDQDEFLDYQAISLDEAYEMIQSGEIRDAKTIMAVYAWHNRLLSTGVNRNGYRFD